MMTLYSYFRSSSSYRIRIALNLKKVDHKIKVINLLKGEEKTDEFLSINSQGLVPALILKDGEVITQSTAIVEYLETTYPKPRLLSENVITVAKQRAMVAVISSEIQPLNNLKVLQYLREKLNIDKVKEQEWYYHWICESFNYLEKQVFATPYAMGSAISIVDVFLIPQIFNAIRFNVSLSNYPKLEKIYEACNQLQEFIDAAPENQEESKKTHVVQNSLAN